MTKMNKILKFLKKQDMLEKFNKDTGKWETVKMDLSDPKIYEVIQIMTAELEILVRIEQLRLQIYNGDLALDEYMKMKDDKEAFIKYLEEKYPKDDKDKEKTKEK